ncbi:hypothetical protein FRACYDRAFT_241396 [Fragilariopsis cylindrus CCMP1102]|uniref:Uncharacterized protein n=1 Tax=Fragilariopsis cylindrus CCMP1102 TaxID=635003 RepID=A0A1E7F9M7_9STRA|nr:hypothetical protein FRACYDRAFT_241396 [Fragilariopsis cylindrus CCMP1102]|eukprot:OEU14839.1 hypothetical protein FRACYDRAFT_241396 [Fragilariopsis cylindrus CCMP1102]
MMGSGSTSTSKRSLVLLCGATIAVGAAAYLLLRNEVTTTAVAVVAPREEVEKAPTVAIPTAADLLKYGSVDDDDDDVDNDVEKSSSSPSTVIETKKETPITSRSLPISTGANVTEVADLQKTTITRSDNNDGAVVAVTAKNNTSKSPIKPKTKKWLDRIATKKGNKKNKEEERNKTMNEDEIDTFLEDLSSAATTTTATTKEIPSPPALSTSEIVSPKEKPTNSETTSDVNKVEEVPPSTPWVGDVDEHYERTSSDSPTESNKPSIPFNEIPTTTTTTNVTSRNRRRRNRGKKKDKVAPATTTTTSPPTSSATTTTTTTTTTKGGAKQQLPTKNSTYVANTIRKTTPSSSNTTNGGGGGGGEEAGVAESSSATDPASIAADMAKNKKKRNRRKRKPKGTAQSAAVKEMKEFQQKG